MTAKETIHQLVRQALKTLDLPEIELTLEHPADPSHGDYASNAALVLYGQLAGTDKASYASPRALAQAIVDAMPSDPAIAKVEVAGPGFINFTLSDEFLNEQLGKILASSDFSDVVPQTNAGKNKEKVLKRVQDNDNSLVPQINRGKRIVIEFTDPNPFKQFHIGHLYSNTVGEAICRLLEATGADVRRVNYFGDVGIHVANSIWGLIQLFKQEGIDLETMANWPLPDRIKFLGRAYAYGATAYKNDPTAKTPIAELNKLLYVVAQDLIKEQELTYTQYQDAWQPVVDYASFINQELLDEYGFDYQYIRQLYQTGRTWTLDYFNTIYDRLGMQFDGFYPESVVAEVGMITVQEGLEKGVFEQSDGAIIFPGEKYNLHTRVFINSNGLPTYETKELGLAPTKYVDQPYDRSIIVTGNEINEYFQVLITALKELKPELGNKTEHLGHGMVRLPQGKMSSRTGDVITGEWLLNEAHSKIMDVLTANNQGVQATKQAKTGSNQAMPSVAAENQQQIAEAVGQAAIKYAFLQSNIGKDVIFDFDESLSFQGKSGPYLQYTLVRCLSVLRKAMVEPHGEKTQTSLEIEIDPGSSPGLQRVNTSGARASSMKNGASISDSKEYIALHIDILLNTKVSFDITKPGFLEGHTWSLIEKDLLRNLYQYSEYVLLAAQELAPHHLSHYLHQLAQQFNVFYSQHQIVSAENAAAKRARLALTAATAKVLAAGLGVLNIAVVEEM